MTSQRQRPSSPTKTRRSLRRSASITTSLATATLLAAGLVTACSSSGSSDSTDSSGGKTKIVVVSLKPGSEKEAFAAFDEQVKQFEKANPQIEVTPKEYEWTGPTFASQLAGGTLPTVFTIPFTDGKTLIEKGQLADLSQEMKPYDYVSKFNKNVVVAGQDSKGTLYAVPTAAYGIGLQYNRTLFTQAGLDPNKPPTTWAEVREDAKQIAEKTGQAGFAQMTKDNTGGWMLTTLTYALGGRMEKSEGDKFTATVDNDKTKKALTMLKQMRWDDNSMGSEFLYDWTGINQAFAAGKIGMYMGGSDVYTSLVQQNKINPDDYGLAALPLAGGDAGLLGGGTLAAVNVKATAAQKTAAAKWIDFYYMRKLTTQDGAVTDAKTLAASDQPVGVPQLPVFDKATYDQSLGWIKDFVNVPLDQMSSFTDKVFDQPLTPEPQSHTQDVYTALDSVVQAVLTDQNADIDALLKDANTKVQAILDKG